MRTGKRSAAMLVTALVAVAISSVGVPGRPPGDGAPGAAAQASVSLTVDPADDLVDGQRVAVLGAGMRPGDFVLVGQCSASAESITDGPCRYSAADTDESGSFETEVLVRAVLGEGEIDCRVPGACVMIAAATTTPPTTTSRPDGSLWASTRRSARPAADPDGLAERRPRRQPDRGAVGCRRARGLGRGPAVHGGTERMAGLRPGHVRLAEVSGGTFELSQRVFAVIGTGAGTVDCRVAGRCA